jgi:hypothetical protein
MTAYLPPHLLALFKAGPPLNYIPQIQPESHTITYASKMAGVSKYTELFEAAEDCPPPTKGLTKEQRAVIRVGDLSLVWGRGCQFLSYLRAHDIINTNINNCSIPFGLF